MFFVTYFRLLLLLFAVDIDVIIGDCCFPLPLKNMALSCPSICCCGRLFEITDQFFGITFQITPVFGIV